MKKTSFFYNNSLSIVFLMLFLISITGQAITGWHQYVDFLKDHNQPIVGLISYLKSGHFIQSTFENWESEFFQMGLFV